MRRVDGARRIYGLDGGGAERVVITLANRLDRSLYEPVLILLYAGGKYLSHIRPDVRVIQLYKQMSGETSGQAPDASGMAGSGLVLQVKEQLRQRLSALPAEAAHLKTIGWSDGQHGVANLVSSDTPAELSLPSDCRTRQAEVIVNARVAVDPDVLSEQVDAAVDEVCRKTGAT